MPRNDAEWNDGYVQGWNAARKRCAQELEAAYAECNTLNLLHGATRIRALTPEKDR